MVHRCDVERDASLVGPADDWGGPATPVWNLHLNELSCRFWFEQGSTVMDGDKQVELTRRKLIVPEETDLTEDDRVVNVRDQRNRVLADGPMRVDSVGRREGHLVAWLVDVR